ncbi:MAG: HAD-IA family hydrolase [Spirochaetota bacterium]|nr:HAD-IA family hydrolase [Spirochaetota bacterium]
MYKDIKICLFDFDGTLVDTMGSFANLAASIIEREYNIPFNKARKMYLDTSGIPFFQQLEVLFPSQPKNPYLASEFESKKQESFFSESFSDETIYALKALKDIGIQIAISSNNFQELIEQFVKRENVQFNYVLGFRENFSKGKDHFYYIKNKLNCKSNELLFVGDSLKDAEKAFECGIHFIAKLGTFSKEDFLNIYPKIVAIENLNELVGILKL